MLYKLHINLGCLKFITGIHLSPASEKLLTVLFILYPSKTKHHLIMAFYSNEF